MRSSTGTLDTVSLRSTIDRSTTELTSFTVLDEVERKNEYIGGYAGHILIGTTVIGGGIVTLLYYLLQSS
jgi:hypothetical protein